MNLVFGAVFGVTNVNISAQAQASIRLGGAADCGLCVVGARLPRLPERRRLHLRRRRRRSTAASTSRTTAWSRPTGSSRSRAPPPDRWTATPPTRWSGQPPVDDPLANYPLPQRLQRDDREDRPLRDRDHARPRDLRRRTTSATAPASSSPGSTSSPAQWDFSGTSALDATSGVTLYFTCGSVTAPTPCNPPGQDGGWLDAGGNGNIHIVAPTTGPTAGLAIAYDRLNIRDLEISGEGSASYVGHHLRARRATCGTTATGARAPTSR